MEQGSSSSQENEGKDSLKKVKSSLAQRHKNLERNLVVLAAYWSCFLKNKKMRFNFKFTLMKNIKLSKRYHKTERKILLFSTDTRYLTECHPE